MDDKQAFFVQSVDGRRFKMVIRGDLGKLSVGKIRRYLKSYGVPDGQSLIFNGVSLEDSAVGGDFGLHNNAVLHLADPSQQTNNNNNINNNNNNNSGNSGAIEEENRTGGVFPAALQADNTTGLLTTNNTNTNISTISSAHVDPESVIGLRTVTQSGSLPSLNNTMNSNMNTINNNNNKNNISRFSTVLEAENLQLRDEVQRLRQELTEMQEHQKNYEGGNNKKSEKPSLDLMQNAKANLKELSEELGVTLQFDMNLTCVIGTDERHTVLVTFDYATERLYLYSTLLTHLPEDAAVRVKLYELLLEGSLLGREVCGGGIGMSLQNGIVLLSTTIPLRNCNSFALKEIMPSFVETVGRWRSLINELVE